MTSYIHVFTSLRNSKASSVFEDQCLANSPFLAGSLLPHQFIWPLTMVKQGK